LAVAEPLGVSLASELEPRLPRARADPLQLSMVLRNLIANAIESAGSSAGARQVLVRAQLVPEGLLVRVDDSGAGIDSGRLRSLFDALPSRKPGGMGVGLSICRVIVEAHGGRLWAEPGPGGHFFLLLPIDDHA
jgi:signal transduction histidine kinase